MYRDMYCNIYKKDLNDLSSNFIDLRIDIFAKNFDEYDTCGLQYVAHNTDLSTCM